MKEVLYTRRGGGLIGSRTLSFWSSRWANWPLCRLTLTNQGVTLSFLSRSRTLRYDDIAYVKVSRAGFLRVFASQAEDSFGFTGTGLDQVIEVLRSKAVAIEPNALQKVGFAKWVILFENVLAIAVVITVLVYYMTMHP